MAARFDSMTFDAFAKGLLDRFLAATPDGWRPKPAYEINFKINQSTLGRVLRDELSTTDTSLSTSQRQYIDDRELYSVFTARLTEQCVPRSASSLHVAAHDLWKYFLRRGKSSELNFQMIARLAELILRTNAALTEALRTAYSFVFLDEFQDTSSVHYDLLLTAFCGSTSVVTAVGDNKQRVNKWAGALEGIFEKYQTAFAADRQCLRMNFRSAPELVRIQGFFAAAIDNTTPPAMARPDASGGECKAFSFASHVDEAKYVAASVKGWIEAQKLQPRDVCILCRQLPATYGELLRTELARVGLPARVENELQDLLAEPLTELVIATLRLAGGGKHSSSWHTAVEYLCTLKGVLTDKQEIIATDLLDKFTSLLHLTFEVKPPTSETISGVVDEIIKFYGEDALRSAFPQYTQGQFFQETVKAIADQLEGRLATQDLLTALNDLEGLGSIPIMTMHKSKGLEYHSVVFIGLEDSALWGFAKEPLEETCGFFVALSRAKERVWFTFSKTRPDRKGNVGVQQRTSIRKIYDLLAQAGVAVEVIRSP